MHILKVLKFRTFTILTLGGPLVAQMKAHALTKKYLKRLKSIFAFPIRSRPRDFEKSAYIKGVVDKNFEALDNFHGHIRTQHGRLPL